MQFITKLFRPQVQKTQKKDKGFHQLQQLQYEILKYSSLEVPSQVRSIDITLSDESWMHEIACGFQNQKHIVLLHGYGGSAITFVRLFAPLSKKYHVHALDFMGMGLSGRRVFSLDMNVRQMVDYYIDAIEEWRAKSGIKTFTLGGHSFGGYMAASYAFKYPKNVERLILISPVGTKFNDKQSSHREYQQMRGSGSFGKKMFLGMAKTLMGWQITPSRVLNWAIFGNMMLDRIVQQRLKLQDKQKQHWKQYFRQVSKLTPNSEGSFWRLFFMPGAGTSNPTSAVLQKIKFPFQIQFYYGDSDWMQKQTALQLTQSQTLNKISYTIVKNAGHQIVFDNPQLMAKYILQ